MAGAVIASAPVCTRADAVGAGSGSGVSDAQRSVVGREDDGRC
jgi:hypothetical protein